VVFPLIKSRYEISLFFFFLTAYQEISVEDELESRENKGKPSPMAVRTEGLFLDEGQQGRGPNGTLQKPNQGVEHPSAVILIVHFAGIVSNVNSHTSAERLLYVFDTIFFS